MVESYAEVLRTEAHKLGDHGLSEKDFYDGGVFRGAIERLRGQFSAGMMEKRLFAQAVLNHLQDNGYIEDWSSAGSDNRHDYRIDLPSGKKACIELKGCLDGNNTNIFERPANAEEFVLWSVCTNTASDPRKNLWSGLHTRLSAEIIANSKPVDGLVVFDMVCGTLGRPCPKVGTEGSRRTRVGQYSLPPPCIYVLPRTIPSVRNNPAPLAQSLSQVEILEAFQKCFGGRDDEVNYVDFEVRQSGQELVRTTRIRRGGRTCRESDPTAIRRS